MFLTLIKLYKANEDVDYTKQELAKIMDLSLQDFQRIFELLLKEKIIYDNGKQKRTMVISGNIKETDATVFRVQFVALDNYVFNKTEEGKILFSRSHKYINRTDLKITSKLETLF